MRNADIKKNNEKDIYKSRQQKKLLVMNTQTHL